MLLELSILFSAIDSIVAVADANERAEEVKDPDGHKDDEQMRLKNCVERLSSVLRRVRQVVTCADKSSVRSQEVRRVANEREVGSENDQVAYRPDPEASDTNRVTSC